MLASDTHLHDLVTACARPLGDPDVKTIIAPLINLALDVDRLIALAGKHRVLPLMYTHFQAMGPGRVPPGLMQQLTEHFRGQALNNYQLTQTLGQVLKLLGDHGIPAIPWKGPGLALMAYGDLKLRPFSDLDLIVPESQIEMAKDLLCDHGYRLLGNLTKRQQTRHRRTFHAYTLYPKAGNGCIKAGNGCIHLHWRITQHYIPFPFDMAALWQRLEIIDLEGRIVYGLSPEDTLLLLCVHGTVHRWAALGWLSDIASLIQRFPKLDWNIVLEHSQRLNSERVVLLGLYLCHELLGTKLPFQVHSRIQATPVLGKLSAQVQSRLWVTPSSQWQRLVHYGLASQTLSHLPDRLRFWWRTAGWVLEPRLKSKMQGVFLRWRYRHFLNVNLRKIH